MPSSCCSWASTVITVGLAIGSCYAQIIYAGCDVSSAKIKLPPNQSVLKVPSAEPNSIALGIGYQNYTCTSEGKYNHIYTTTEMYDISCLKQAKGQAFDIVQNIVYELWNNKAVVASFDKVLNEPKPAQAIDIGLKGLADLDLFMKDSWLLDIHLGSHVASPAELKQYLFSYYGVWRKGDPDPSNTYVLANETGTLPAPTGPIDIPWKSLKKAQYNLADTIMIVDTVGGQAPKSCKPGSKQLDVPYVAKYWFFGGPASKY